ncbi:MULTISPECIES: DNA polymerase IV [Shewanella]|uniref:DNA polymerase IV n=1 Tax=Shewanella TaxID=22 RepID=UPI0002F3405F|nr:MULTISPECIES: DNA polymerase IV [Shewanella]MDV5247914.1 DNA polymerase IV [Shewanella xiamenensis]PWH03688.1 DNA polymerase IV [Shewanella xiamenensis]
MRKIIHVDMDCYFAAVEMRDFPEYRGKPLAVGGSRERRGVISTCNYKARRFGVRSAMATAYALKLCPDLILVPGRMQVYKEVSQQIRAIFSRYTELIEPLSLDEAYLDVSDCKLFKGSATLIAEAIRHDILAETGLTASAGVAPVKFLAKVASDLNKPNGLYVISPDKVPEFIKTLSLRKIPGVGKVTAEKLSSLGLNTCGDIQTYPKQDLITRFGKFGAVLIERSHGIDERGLSVSRERKSVGVETTLAQDIYSLEQCQQVMPGLIHELSTRLSRSAKDRQIHKQVVKLKFSDFKQTTIEHRSDEVSIVMFYELLSQAMARQEGRGIRLLGISVGLAESKDTLQPIMARETKQLDLVF